MVKPKILLSVTPSGWAYDNRCIAIQNLLAEKYDIVKQDAKYTKDFSGNFDLTYFSGFEAVPRYSQRSRRVCTTIGGLVVKTMEDALGITDIASAIAIPNKTWHKKFLEKDLGKKIYYIPNGVDTNRFKFKDSSRDSFTIGWAGNDRPYRLPIKRIDVLRRKCGILGLKLLERNWGHNQIPHSEMHNFYDDVDVYINVSTTEGSNNPILEACSSGIPVIATAVGNVPDLIDHGVLPLNHDLSNLCNRILEVRVMSKDMRDSIGGKLRSHIIDEYGIKSIANKYSEMFDYCLSLNPRVTKPVIIRRGVI